MKKKKISKVIVASVATVAGIFGGMKIYANRKKDRKAQIGAIKNQSAIDEVE